MSRAILSLTALAFMAFGAGRPLASEHWTYPDATEPEGSAELNLGRMNYDAFCASCHGKTARGTDKGPTFISRVYHPGHHGDAAFFVAPRDGARAHHWHFGNMPPVEGVTEAQLKTILRYVRAVQRTNGLF